MITLKKTYKAVNFTRSFAHNLGASESALDYCTNIVRQHDYENFMATLLMTKSIRTPALVVRAFNVEVARVQDQTNDQYNAVFRLQFWHDALQSIYKKDQDITKVPANPTVKELFKICKCYNLQKRHLEKLITSRNNILKTKHFQTLEDVEKYSEESVSSIYYLLLAVAGITDVHADHAASHLGKAQGLVNCLRSIHVSNRHKIVSLPMDILMKNKVSQETVLRSNHSEELKNAVFEVASRANSHLEKARKIQVPKLAKQIFLPATSVDMYLKKLQKNNFYVFDKSLQYGNPILPLILYYKRLVNKY